MKYTYYDRQYPFSPPAHSTLEFSYYLDGATAVAHVEDPEERLDGYIAWLKKHMPEAWESDQIPILWLVEHDRGPCLAPFPEVWSHIEECETFADVWTKPIGENGERVRWDRLAITTFETMFEEVLSWKPRAFQKSAPLRNLVETRRVMSASE